MNHPIDLSASRDDSVDVQMSWDGQENAPEKSEDSASKSGSAPNSQQAGNPRQKYRLINRLVDKLRPMEAAPPTAGLNPNSDSKRLLAETQHGRETSPPMTFTYPPGSRPLPRYTIRRGIGVGGFGEVYFAVSDAGKEVAIKRIQRNLEIELRGASHCLNLKHPNLVSLYDICRDDNDQSWVVMEYVAGKNLRQILDQAPAGLPIEEVNRWFTAIASGVSHLHSAGLVHRDLKPGNVFDDLGIVKVGDYGLSKFISASHRGGHTESVGTFHYMAPEIGRGQYGREIDIYALGIMLYELLTGRVPFDGESSHEIIVKHLTAIPDLKGIDQPYRSVIAKCLEKDPEKRYRSVPEMMQALSLPERDAAPGVIPAQLVHKLPHKCSAADHIEPAILVDDQGREQRREQDAATRAATRAANTPADRDRPSPPAVSQEPLARAVGATFTDLGNWWRTLDRSPVTKAILVVAAGFFLLLNSHWLILVLTLTAIFYVPYYILRQMVLHVSQQPTYAEAQRAHAEAQRFAQAVPARKPVRPVSRRQWCQQMRNDLRAKRSLQRTAELNTSWIASTLTVLGLTLGAGLLLLRHGPVDAVSIAPYAWMGTVVMLSSLGILGLGKLWEREEGEGMPRRFVLAGLGAGVGAAAYGINQYLMLPLDQSLLRDIDATELPAALYHNEVPMVGAMMAHFALLFAMLRWWKPVDPLRRRRMGIWPVAVAVLAEWGVHQVLPIPQPAGMMIAGGTAIAIQMGAPWISRRAQPTPAALESDQYGQAASQQPPNQFSRRQEYGMNVMIRSCFSCCLIWLGRNRGCRRDQRGRSRRQTDRRIVGRAAGSRHLPR